MRIRTIKPEFWTHPVMSRQADETKLLAIGLLNYSDDEGFFFADCRMIRAALRPLDEDSTIVRRSLDYLSIIGYVEIREHPTHGPVGRVVNWIAHQKIDRPSKSKIRGFFDACSLSENGAQPTRFDEDSTIVRRSLDERSSLEQGTGIKGTGIREQDLAPAGAGGAPGQQDLSSSPEILPTPPPTATQGTLPGEITAEAIYDAYPRKVARQDALVAISKAMKLRPAADLLFRVKQYAAATGKWNDHDRKFIPHPATWFNRGSYDDDPATWERNYANPNQRPAPSAQDHANEPWGELG